MYGLWYRRQKVYLGVEGISPWLPHDVGSSYVDIIIESGNDHICTLWYAYHRSVHSKKNMARSYRPILSLLEIRLYIRVHYLLH